MRLNQFIAHNGKYSRREADKLIEQGRVSIGKIKADTKSVLNDGDVVFIDGKRLHKSYQYTCIVYHKPKGEIVSKNDPQQRRVIYDSLDKQYRHFASVGRLDFASEGLLILSDNKEVVRKLMESKLNREYILKLDGTITQKMIGAFENGLELEDATLGGHSKSKIKSMNFKPFVSFAIIKNDRNFSKLKVCIAQGQNRELRRFFAFFKREVLDLKRVAYGFVHLNALPCGKSRFFSKDEYKQLREFMQNA